MASGKSTVAAEFAKLGCAVIDADRIAHELLEKKNVKDKIIASFGQAILDSTGRINRKKLADIAFSDVDRLSSLTTIVHPFVLERAEQLLKKYNAESQVKAIVLDMPLLVEVGWHSRCDRLIFVHCDRQLRVERAQKMGFDENQIKIRENFQISLDSKARLADNIVENNSDFSAIAKQVINIFSYTVDNG